MAHLILASQSPRRQELLRRIGVTDFTVLATDSDESWDSAWSPEELVSRLSARKAAAAKAPPPARRMNPPRKVGARSLLPGFRINGCESPFHSLS